MSYVEVFVIDPDGTVLSYDEAKNNHGFAPCVWEQLAERFNLVGTRFFMSGEVLEPLWGMAGTGKLKLEDDLLLQATFDYVMIPKVLVQPLARYMRTFYETELRSKNIVQTMLQLAGILEEILKETPDLLGVCFNGCSANDSYWYVRNETEDNHPRNIFTELGKAWWVDTEYFKDLIQEN